MPKKKEYMTTVSPDPESNGELPDYALGRNLLASSGAYLVHRVHAYCI
jgi:hypothetical protein